MEVFAHPTKRSFLAVVTSVEIAQSEVRVNFGNAIDNHRGLQLSLLVDDFLVLQCVAQKGLWMDPSG